MDSNQGANEIFVTKIIIANILNIENFEIPLSETERKHLIITGRNGSGKTTVLKTIKLVLDYNAFTTESNITKASKFDSVVKFDTHIRDNKILIYGPNQQYLTERINSGQLLYAVFEAKRDLQFLPPAGIQKVRLSKYNDVNESIGKHFIQYIVNLKADQSFARDEGDDESVKRTDAWFKNFESHLFELFDTDTAELQFDRKNYNFNIIEKDKPPYNLNQLSDGYAAIMNIVTELIMRMEPHKTKSYDLQGLVLIDEVETHLHIALQKKILPFLIAFFPKIQFIVTTHSPFVINSVSNAVVCDLEKRIVTHDLSGYSWEALVESYFDSDKYSDELKAKVEEFERLMDKTERTDDESDKLSELKTYLYQLPKFASDELAVRIQQIRLRHLKNK